MTHLNAMKLYHFDPFAHLLKEQATVGALRLAAGDHDVSIQALSHERTGEKTTFADWTKKLDETNAVAQK